MNFLTSDNDYLSEPKPARQSIPCIVEIGSADLRGDAAVAAYLRAAVSESTRRAYRADLAHFLGWGGHIPATDEAVARYLAEHAGILSNATLTRRLAAISKAHAMQAEPSPTRSHLVVMTMRGIRRSHGRPQRRVAAAIKADIVAMVAALGSGLGDRRDCALLLIGFAGALRRSELCAIDCTDIERVPQGIIVTLRRSKTDQEGHGRKIGIPHARGNVCAVRALDNWLAASGIAAGPIFRSVSRHGRIGTSRLCDRAVGSIVRHRAEAAGLDARRYAGHSLRAGLATSAAAAGVSSAKIREQTGHASDAMLQRYIRDGELFVGNAAGAVL